MDRRLQHVELLAQGALPRYFLAQQPGSIGAVEEQPGIALVAVVVAEAGAVEVYSKL